MSRQSLIQAIQSDLANNISGLIEPIHVRRNLEAILAESVLTEDIGNSVVSSSDQRVQSATPNTRSIIAGTGLEGGGNFQSDRTLSIKFGTTANTAAMGNDSRIVNAVQTSRTISAGNGLSGGGNLSANRTLSVVFGTTANTAAMGNDSRIVGAVQKSGSGQALSGGYLHTPYNYGNLSVGNIQLNPANGMSGKITRNSSNNAIQAPSGTPAGIYTMVIFIDGTSSTGSPSLSGFSNEDFGDDMPGSGQHAWLYVTIGPDSKTAKIEAIDY